MPHKILDTHIETSQILISPIEIKAKIPLTVATENTVLKYRKQVEDILDGKDKRKFIVVGPCSIHDIKAGEEYAKRLKGLAEKVHDQFLLIMRVYFEKPRTTTGWKGLINDPDLNDSFNIEKGLILAREFLLRISELDLPAGTEALDPFVPQYIGDLISWTAIGARTTESQTHREMASGLSMPVGFKNGTDGGIEVAMNALQSAQSPHSFLGINPRGLVCVFKTKGNAYGHVILRGGNGQPNFYPEQVKEVEEKLKAANLPHKLVIDCSHGNSNKDHRKQSYVFENVIDQIIEGNQSIVGLMLESNIHEGNQNIPKDLDQLKYGVSVTDKCMNWEETERVILAAHEKLKMANG
jgi:3-deoxy-7-phosphoheptulonate synthase